MFTTLHILCCIIVATTGIILLESALVSSAKLPDSAPSAKKRTVKLGDSCSENKDCAAAFSECHAGKCQCTAGTQKHLNSCEPSERSCPFGPALSRDGSMVACTVNLFDQNNKECGENYYCLAEAEVSFGNPRGFCCPKPLNCPVGKSSPQYSCTALGPDQLDKLQPCPTETHYCFKVEVGGVNGFLSCCPKPCSNNEGYKDGQCYTALEIGEKCEFTEQCIEKGATCKNGVCACDERDQINSGGQCIAPYCGSGTVIKLPDGGGIVRCNSTKDDCPSKTYCTDGNFCCPFPAEFCWQTAVPVDPSRPKCDPRKADEQQCRPGENCNEWYTDFERPNGKLVSHGFCCLKNRPGHLPFSHGQGGRYND